MARLYPHPTRPHPRAHSPRPTGARHTIPSPAGPACPATSLPPHSASATRHSPANPTLSPCAAEIDSPAYTCARALVPLGVMSRVCAHARLVSATRPPSGCHLLLLLLLPPANANPRLRPCPHPRPRHGHPLLLQLPLFYVMHACLLLLPMRVHSSSAPYSLWPPLRPAHGATRRPQATVLYNLQCEFDQTDVYTFSRGEQRNAQGVWRSSNGYREEDGDNRIDCDGATRDKRSVFMISRPSRLEIVISKTDSTRDPCSQSQSQSRPRASSRRPLLMTTWRGLQDQTTSRRPRRPRRHRREDPSRGP